MCAVPLCTQPCCNTPQPHSSSLPPPSLSLAAAAAATGAAPCAPLQLLRTERGHQIEEAKAAPPGASTTMPRVLRQSAAARPPSPAPAPSSAADAFVAAVISSPPAPYAAGSPSPGPSPAPEPAAAAAVGGRRSGAALSPPLIAMLAVVGAALLVVLYARLVSRVFRAARRRWRRRRLRLLVPGSPSSINGDSFTTYDNFYHTFSPFHPHGHHGLDDAAIKSLPSAHFFSAASSGSGRCSGAGERECAVCLLEFANGDELRALPLCAHAFHADCVDVWLRAHASCPLCRAAVALPSPVRAGPVGLWPRHHRPSLDDLLFFNPLPPPPLPASHDAAFAGLPEIAPASPDRPLDPRDFLLKRSYSFGFERSLASSVDGGAPATASPPWRFRFAAAGDGALRGRSFWSKRWPSPFGGGGGGSAAARVFSFRSYRSAAAKSSPFSRRRSVAGGAGGGGGGSGLFMSLASEPPSILAAARRTRAASTSRLRCGDPEALLSPDRLSSR